MKYNVFNIIHTHYAKLDKIFVIKIDRLLLEYEIKNQSDLVKI